MKEPETTSTVESPDKRAEQIRGGSILIRVTTNREPPHPGVMLLTEYLKPMGISQRDLANAIHLPYQRVNELVNRRRGITPSTALRLARYFGSRVSFWLSLQHCWNLYRAPQSEAAELEHIQPMKLGS